MFWIIQCQKYGSPNKGLDDAKAFSLLLTSVRGGVYFRAVKEKGQGGIERVEWTLATTRAGSERKVVERLERFGVFYHHFRIRRTAVSRGRLVDRLISAYPRYLWIATSYGFGPSPAWRVMMDCGAYPVRGAENVPIIIPNSIIDDLVAGSKDDIFEDLIQGRFRRGDKVQAVGGLYLGHIGTFDRYAARTGTCIVLFDAFGQVVPFPLNEADLILYTREGRKRHNPKRRRQAWKRTQDQQVVAQSIT